MENIEVLIGKKVKEARLKLGMSQSDLAKNAKTSLTTINRLEKGHQFPHSSTLNEIARALRMSVKDFYKEDSVVEQSTSRAQMILDIQSRIMKLSDEQLEDVVDSLYHIENPLEEEDDIQERSEKKR